jgi:hypothetical protein
MGKEWAYENKYNVQYFEKIDHVTPVGKKLMLLIHCMTTDLYHNMTAEFYNCIKRRFVYEELGFH